MPTFEVGSIEPFGSHFPDGEFRVVVFSHRHSPNQKNLAARRVAFDQSGDSRLRDDRTAAGDQIGQRPECLMNANRRGSLPLSPGRLGAPRVVSEYYVKDELRMTSGQLADDLSKRTLSPVAANQEDLIRISR